jgi:hypothetical protein
MKSARTRLSAPDLAILGFLAICGVLAPLSSDREFLAHQRWAASTQIARMPSASKPPASAVEIKASASRAVQDLEAVLYVTCPGLALIAYRPRRSVRPRRRGPGHVALAIAGGLVSYGLASFCWFTYGPAEWTGYTPNTMAGRPSTFWTHLPHGLGDAITYGILSGWLYLAVIRGWGESRLPLERTGRWLGLAWIIASVVSWSTDLIK